MSYRDHPPNVGTQRGAILNLLVAANGGWVPLPEILALKVAQYNARLSELREQGFKIINRTERVNGKTHSWFRLELGFESQQHSSSLQIRTNEPKRVEQRPSKEGVEETPAETSSLFPSVERQRTAIEYETGVRHGGK
jgi:hypothetical protein